MRSRGAAGVVLFLADVAERRARRLVAAGRQTTSPPAQCQLVRNSIRALYVPSLATCLTSHFCKHVLLKYLLLGTLYINLVRNGR